MAYHFLAPSLLYHQLESNGNLTCLAVMTAVTVGQNNSVCPNDWLLNQEKYKFSTSSKTWDENQCDCTKFQAHLPVIDNLKELKFIQKNLKPRHLSWIGLYIISPRKQWMWIDEHPFVEQKCKHFFIIGATDNMSCAVTTGNQVYSEDCNSRFNGICQRDCLNNKGK
ncbi:LOW QUALITY PROTEIN: killer cell lectin-like receptor subfamily F member 2 [Rhynchonycteris naso]